MVDGRLRSPALSTCAASTLLLLLLACEDRAPVATDPATVARDSAGIRIVENPEHAPDSTSWSIGSAPTLVIGDDEAKGRNYLFGSIAGARRLSDGRIVVADEARGEVRMYDSSGAYLREIGRVGRGPGEFRSVGGVMLLGDSIVVPSYYAGAIAPLFTPDGGYVRSYSAALRLPEDSSGTAGQGYVAGVFGDGSVLVRFVSDAWNPAERAYPAPSVIDRTQRLVRLTASGRVAADLGRHPYGRMIRYDNGGDQGFSIVDAPYLPRAREVPAGTGLYFSRGLAFEMELYDSLGALRRIIRKRHPPVTFSEAWADSAWSATTSGLPAEMAWLKRADPPPVRDAPTIDRLLLDSEGNLWARSGTPDQVGVPRWFVFDDAGVLRYSLRSALDLQQIGGDYVLTVERDALGVQSVLLYPLLKR